MSTPIFDQLVAEFEARRNVKFETLLAPVISGARPADYIMDEFNTVVTGVANTVKTADDTIEFTATTNYFKPAKPTVISLVERGAA